MIPFFAVGAKYSSTGNSLEGIETAGYHATAGKWLHGRTRPGTFLNLRQGLYYVILAVVTFVYLICSIRTNVCLFLALLVLVVTYNLYAAVHFYSALGNGAVAAKVEMVCDDILDSLCTFNLFLQKITLTSRIKAAGACNFVLCIPIWYIFVAQMLESIDFPLVLPVGDLSEVVQGKNQKARKRVDKEG